MKTNKTWLLSWFAAALAAGVTSVAAQDGGGTSNASSPAPVAGVAPAGTRLNFTSLDPSHPYPLSGTLYLPGKSATPCPAVVMIHGTSGINCVGAFYRDSILKAGIAIFEVDFKTGIYTGPRDRPSPDTLVAMGFAALKELRKSPAIDPDRIGIMGFSMGGHLTVNAAFEKKPQIMDGR